MSFFEALSYKADKAVSNSTVFATCFRNKHDKSIQVGLNIFNMYIHMST